MTGAAALAALGCFLWGVVSVLFSPCHLASIPLMVAYVAGQEKAVNPRQAVGYSAAFTIGLFITIALIGVICALLGRMLGDVGNYWQILVGAVLIWVALGMLGVESCTLSNSLLGRFNMKGLPGAFALGLSYGILSGSCTFGFIAPDPGHHHGPGGYRHRDGLDRPFCRRPLPADHGGGKLDGPGEKPHGEPRLAGGGKLVPKRRRRRHRVPRPLFHREPLYQRDNQTKNNLPQEVIMKKNHTDPRAGLPEVQETGRGV